MTNNTDQLLNTGISLPDIYTKVLSAVAVRARQLHTGVLLYLKLPEFSSITPKSYLKEGPVKACLLAVNVHKVYNTGDGILAEWVEEDTIPLCSIISRAIHCAFKLLDMGNKDKEKHPFSKIAISAGKFSGVQMGEGQQCAVMGSAVDEIQLTVKLLEHDGILLSPEAWRLCNREVLSVTHIENESAVMVQSINGDQPDQLEEMIQYYSNVPLKEYPKRAYLVTIEDREILISQYMVESALKQINETQEQEDLPEVLPSTIMCVNLQLVQLDTDLSSSHHKALEIMENEMQSCSGKICNIFSFDEGCIFFCLVDLPLAERQDNPAHMMDAANRIHTTCYQELDIFSSVSVGVTTGRVKYSLDDTSLKLEYRVYGEKVNLAAKLTIESQGVVSCDTTTKLYSMMPFRQLLPQGISQHEEVRYEAEINEMFADVDASSSTGMDSRRMVLAHMQTLKEDEQMVVEYASVIGNTFTFEMLQNILPKMTEEDLINHLNTLFRLGIFMCASKPKHNSSAKNCHCEHRPTLTSAFKADPEWLCPLMCFSNRDELEVVALKLLNRCSKTHRTIHKDCVKYFEEKSYRCSKCENRKFIHSFKTAMYSRNDLQMIFQSQGIDCLNQMFTSVINGNDKKNFLEKMKSVVMEARDRTSSEGGCECAQLVEVVLIHRLKHWRCIGNELKTFFYLVETAAAYVYHKKDSTALEFLSEARAIMEFPSSRISETDQAFVYRLTAVILFNAGQILEAEEYVEKALKLLNCSLPHNSVAQSLKLMNEKREKFYNKSRRFEIPEDLEDLQECVDCLSFLWQIACIRNQSTIASLAITMEINKAAKSGNPFKILYSATDYLRNSQFQDIDEKCRHLEAFLCRTCASLSDHPEGQKLISHLTQTLAIVKLCSGKLKKSIEYNTLSQHLSEVLNRPGLDTSTTVLLHLSLLLTDRYRESVEQIRILEKLSKDTSNYRAKGWFYASCMNYLLCTGAEFRPFRECLDFLRDSCSDPNVVADKSLMLHLHSAVALWYARTYEWTPFKLFFKKAHEMYNEIRASIESITGAVMLLECSVLLFREYQTEHHEKGIIEFQNPNELFLDFTKRFGERHFLFPRVLHLKASLCRLNGDEEMAENLIGRARTLSEIQGNCIDRKRIK